MGKFPVNAVGLIVVLACVATQVTCQRSRNPTQRWVVSDYPNPQHDYSLCGRRNVSSVCDPNGIITEQDADAIDRDITDVYRNTVCNCPDSQNTRTKHGYIIKVALMPHIERIYPDGENTTAWMLREAQMYSYILTRQWKLEGACNETMLILYAKNDGILYTLTRQITRMRLSDRDVQTISLMVRPYFDRENTIGAGLIELIRRYRLVLEDKRREALQSSSTRSQG